MNRKLIVVGLGYVGLPLAREASRAGLEVIGLDLDVAVVDRINAGRSHVDDLDDRAVQEMLGRGFSATTDPRVIRESDVVVICVPTPLGPDGGPDLGAVEAAATAIADQLRPGMLVVLESTTYPGTTDEVVRAILESGGLRVGADFNLAFSPERVDPGNPVWGIRNTPKIVGGVTASCTERAAGFYRQFVDQVITAAGTREAEMAKLLENTFRHVNIALVNEMARFSHELGIDIWDVIRCASTKPFGYMPFYPGPGVGGHCIPIDPNYLSYRVRTQLGYQFKFVELAQEINASMPGYVFGRIQEELNLQGKAVRGARVLIIGVTYKADIADQRESPAVKLAGQLYAMGAEVLYHDPFVPIWSLPNGELPCVDSLEVGLRGADIGVLLQFHSVYSSFPWGAARTPILDTRGVLQGPQVVTL